MKDYELQNQLGRGAQVPYFSPIHPNLNDFNKTRANTLTYARLKPILGGNGFHMRLILPKRHRPGLCSPEASGILSRNVKGKNFILYFLYSGCGAQSKEEIRWSPRCDQANIPQLIGQERSGMKLRLLKKSSRSYDL
jgi:hypothetical protein